MKAFAVLLVTIVAVNAGSLRINRQAGWSVPSSPTPGWSSTTPPPTTTAAPPTIPPGWGPPPPPSATLTNIELDAALAAVGSGWAGENHADNVLVIGGGGWGPNAELDISSGGISEVDQHGNNIQGTAQDAQSASSINLIAVGQIAEGAEGQSLDALGLSISNQQSGSSAASGEGASAAGGDSIIQVIPVASSLGMAKP